MDKLNHKPTKGHKDILYIHELYGHKNTNCCQALTQPHKFMQYCTKKKKKEHDIIKKYCTPKDDDRTQSLILHCLLLAKMLR